MKAKYKESILQWTSGTGEMAPWAKARAEQIWSPEWIPRLPVMVGKENRTTKLSYRLHTCSGMCTVEHAPPTTLDLHMHNNKFFSKMLNEHLLKDIFKGLKHKLEVKPHEKKKSSTIHFLTTHFQSLAGIFKYQRPHCMLQSLPSSEKSDDFPGESLLFWSSVLNVTKLKKWCGFFFFEISIFYQLRVKFLCQALLTLKCRKACLTDFYTKAERQERQLSDW